MGSLYDRQPLKEPWQIVADIKDRATKHARQQDRALRAMPASEKQVGLVCHLLGMVFGIGDSGDVARHQFLEYVFDRPSSKALTLDEASVLIDWLRDPLGPGPHPSAVAECWTILNAWAEEHGQGRLP